VKLQISATCPEYVRLAGNRKKKSLRPAGSKITEEEESLSGLNCEYKNFINFPLSQTCYISHGGKFACDYQNLIEINKANSIKTVSSIPILIGIHYTAV